MSDSKEYKITIKNFFRHLQVIRKHRFKVFCLCCKVGIPIQGLVHDLSKYSPTEFWESVKYFQGNYSPIKNCKKENGYSNAWLHHKGRNKHHYEYWYDNVAPEPMPMMPFNYFLEMICDTLAAGMTYQGKNWNQGYQLSYWNRVKEKALMNEKMKLLLDEVYTAIKNEGIQPVLKKKRLREMYDRYNTQ